MTAGPQDQILDRRELASALLRALDLRHEVLDAIVDSDDHAAAVRSVSELLETTENNANAVLGLQLGRLTKLERDHLRDEVTNLEATLKWLPEQRPFSTGANVRLRPFTSRDEDADLYRRRSAEQLDDEGAPWASDRVEDERRAGLGRVDDETAAWFVAENTSGDRPECVGLVFGELHGGEVELAVWVAPEARKQGYGTAVIKLSRPELAAFFPGTTVIVRSPA
ncbi:GNAT family N-acetyltransferase [Rhodococcus sp. NPDC058514]|uniref:GNAT family N-acetyltransferase n=1 Tax=unclassified Rhodococcus (in: high G+C Gram-positive bacteria) TaxID=192944 RepID=UPI003660BACB